MEQMSAGGEQYPPRDGESALFSAIRQLDFTTATALILGGCDITTPDDQGATALMLASGIDDTKVTGNDATALVLLLINRGAPLDARDKNGDTALHYAARNNGNVRVLDDAGADRAALNNEGKSAYQVACSAMKDYFDETRPSPFRHCVRSADIAGITRHLPVLMDLPTNERDAVFCEAAMMAANWQHLDVLQILIGAGVPTVLPTALAASSKLGRVKVAEYALARGADPNVASTEYNRALPLALACCGATLEVAKILIANGADVNARDANGETALGYTSYHGFANAVVYLLNQGAHVNEAGDREAPAIHLAAGEGHLEIVNILLAAGAFIKTQHMGLTPFQRAAIKGHSTVVVRLLEELPPFDKGFYLVEANVAAAEGGHLELVRDLIAAGARLDDEASTLEGDMTALMAAASAGHVEVARLLLEHNADINVITDDLVTPLMGAASYGELEMVKLLLEKGADIHRQQIDGTTAVAEAVIAGAVQVVKLLLDAGASMHWAPRMYGTNSYAPITQGDDLLQFACTAMVAPDSHLHPRVDMFRLLLDRGANVNAEYKGEPLFLSAAAWARPECLRILLAHGANAINTAGTEGMTALMWRIGEMSTVDAKSTTRGVEGLRVLLEHGANPCARDFTWERSSVIQHATGKVPVCLDVFKLLLDYGARREDVLNMPPGTYPEQEAVNQFLLEYVPVPRRSQATPITHAGTTYWVMPWSHALHVYAPRAFREAARALCGLVLRAQHATTNTAAELGRVTGRVEGLTLAPGGGNDDAPNDGINTTVDSNVAAAEAATDTVAGIASNTSFGADSVELWARLPNEVFELVVGALWEADNLTRQQTGLPLPLTLTAGEAAAAAAVGPTIIVPA